MKYVVLYTEYTRVSVPDPLMVSSKTISEFCSKQFNDLKEAYSFSKEVNGVLLKAVEVDVNETAEMHGGKV